STGIYVQPAGERALKVGYARNGGRIPVLAEKVPGAGCASGWYQGLHGGFICSSEGTTDAEDPRARLSASPPDLSLVLPYPYARNAHNGTPLYSSVPTADQIAAYEPRREPQAPEVPDDASRPWWQRDGVALSEVRLAELATDSDGLLVRRLVKGFYVAVDREFEWESRTWYKTTKGMVAPKERFVAVEGSPFHGVELSEELTLPVGWAYGSRESRPRYLIDSSGAKATGTLERLHPIRLTGQRVESAGRAYLQTVDLDWVQADQLRVANLPALPTDLAGNEHWIAIDLKSQTLVAMIGSRPAYATLISSGKETNDASTDHRTPNGEWYIREKHVTTTMDGDGSAAGDLPYSIEDVPYVMYFEGSYALHGAFWHRNYGVRMSHGCINLAPLDAKYLFFFTTPTVLEGWHGAWSGNGQKGSRVVITGSSPPPVRARSASAGP
ncbi:MAG TPA: L,D-transpeptidase, partial [Polyangiaceae bacterium]|nr:L,D-transpeptidase [Polyangiaceae bacterium]